MGPAAAQTTSSASDILQLDDISSWLRKHGKPVRPRLDRKQLDALRECFDIIDTDGTGTITADELQDVFKVEYRTLHVLLMQAFQIQSKANHAVMAQALGNHVSLEAVASVLDTVKYHGSDGIGFPDFIDIMSRDSHDLDEGSHNKSNGSATTAYNIALMARAYRYGLVGLIINEHNAVPLIGTALCCNMQCCNAQQAEPCITVKYCATCKCAILQILNSASWAGKARSDAVNKKQSHYLVKVACDHLAECQ